MSENKTIYLTDNPNIEQDSFQVHTNIAETLYEVIKKHDVSESSFTIGLFGEWGSGKSFIVNKLSKIIKESTSNITFINIDVWKYSGQPLLRSILFELDKHFKSFYKSSPEKYTFFKDGYKNSNGKALQDILYYDEVFESVSKLTSSDFKKKLSEIWKRYKIAYIILVGIFILFLISQFLPDEWLQNNYIKKGFNILKTLAPISSFIGIGGILLLLLKKPFEKIAELIFFRNTVKNFTEKANFSPEQFEGIFKDILSKIKEEKYVIVFDNIDRCESNMAYETLSTIKTFMDINNCFYIIPADDDAIKNYLSNSSINQENTDCSFERKFTEEFIDKIFQTYIRIPALKEVERDKYIKEQLIKIDFQDKLTDEDIETITQILYFAYKGESPRNIIRFVNDYSTYFQLALNSISKLLDNIMLFTIMIAVKQKWYHFERILLENPDFFAKYPENKGLLEQIEHNNKKDLERFLDSIQSFYIPQIKHKSVDEYIHFKESERSYEVSDILKNNQPDEFELNDENVKILIREFNKIVITKGQFSVNSFMTFAKLISKNKKHRLYKNLVIEFWLGFIKTPNEQIKLILGEMLDEDVLSKIMNSLNSKKLYAHKKNIEEIILSYFKEPFENDIEFEEYEKVFETIISSEYKFTPSLLKKLFSQWKKESLYLNSLLKIISKKEKTDYLPSNVLSQLVNAPIENTSLELLNNWSNKTISKPIGIKLFQVILERIKQRNFANNPQLAQQKQNIEQDYGLILLLDTSFAETSKIDEFINSISNLISKVFQFATNQQPLFELGVNLWVKITYFASINNNLIDNQLLQIFNQYIKPNPTVLQLLNEKVKYSDDILSLSETKQSIFISSPELQIKLYKELEKEEFSNFDLITSSPIENNHIAVLLKHLKENSIDINNTKFSGFILEKIIKELIDEKIDITKKLIYLRETFDLKDNKQLILDYKNGIIDYYKNKSPNAFNVFKEFNALLSYSEFFNNILKPIISFINSKLSQGEEIKDYVQIAELIGSTNNKKDIELLYSVAKQCVEKSQSIEENYFGISIIEKLFENISDENKDEISVLINDNDHYEHWGEEIIDRLKKIGIISEKDNIEGESPAPNNV